MKVPARKKCENVKLKPEVKSNGMKWWCSIPVFVQIIVTPLVGWISRFWTCKNRSDRTKFIPEKNCFVAFFGFFKCLILWNRTVGWDKSLKNSTWCGPCGLTRTVPSRELWSVLSVLVSNVRFRSNIFQKWSFLDPTVVRTFLFLPKVIA